MVSADGISPNPEKLSAVQDARTVREFLGLSGYCCRFIPNFAKVAGPLQMLTRQDMHFLCKPLSRSVSETEELTHVPPVLAYHCFDKGFVVHTDASDQGLGAVLELEQSDGKLHPIAYATLSQGRRRLRNCELLQ